MDAHDQPPTIDLETCLRFVNTEELTDGLPAERLGSVELAVAFLAEHAAAHGDDLRAQATRVGEGAWLGRLRATRSALREAWDAQVAGHAPERGALDTLNRVLDLAPRIELRAAASGVEVGHRHAGSDPLGEALALLVEPFVMAIDDGHADRFRVCANDGCRWAFEDTSRAGRRRWCDMSTCGNRAKVRRFRSRQRDGDADAPAAGRATGPATGSEG